MAIVIKTIPHIEQRYETVGDYWVDENGDIQIRVSDMGNKDYEFFVAIHEMIEQHFITKEGIKEEDITAFDKRFEKMREEYPDMIGEMEPGDHDSAPYQKEHKIASRIEKWLFDQMYGEKSAEEWEKYGNIVNGLSQK